ncbi:chaperonin CPN60, mitochondrial-like [Papaver somniferum]|uniref:chaperonin CPN60, mitochondrial-like n=1 Tax=Papaver somniferum TaxID=3469 RepID=UPI000E6FDCAC|nr:chaperonin CPN60, mitochondrial-like [Papaver somniferum]
MGVLMQASPKLVHGEERVFKNQISCLTSTSSVKRWSFQKPLPFPPTPKLETKHRNLVITEAKKKNKSDLHSFSPKPEESTGPFPEAILLKQQNVKEDGKLAPEFADSEEEKLFDFLNLQLESDLKYDRMRHYEVVYMIHEDHAEEVGIVNSKVEGFLKEKKGKIWRVSDWGLRRLAYKIKKAKNAHYMLMNFELEAKWINDFKSLLDKDERVIRHLVIKRDEAITEDCPPPPEFHTVRSDMDDSDDDEDLDYEDDDEDYEDEDEDEEEELDDEGLQETIIIVDEEDAGKDRSSASSSASKKGKERAIA